MNVSHSIVSDSLATPWTVACQAPLPIGFFRQEYWSGLLFASPGDLPCIGTELWSPALQADSLPSEPPGMLRTRPNGDVRKAITTIYSVLTECQALYWALLAHRIVMTTL